MGDKIRKFLAQLPHVPSALSLVWTAARSWTVGWAILLVAQGTLPVLIVHLTKATVDSFLPAARSGGRSGSIA